MMRFKKTCRTLGSSILCAAAGVLLAAGAYAEPKISFTSTRDINGEIYSMDTDGSDETNLTNHVDSDSYSAWSPDGTQLAFVSERDGNPEIYKMNADGSGPTRLTDSGSNDLSPAWSPDGTLIAFSTYRDGNMEIYLSCVSGHSGAGPLQ